MKPSTADEESPTRALSLSSHFGGKSDPRRRSLMGGLNKYMGIKTTGATAKNGFAQFQDTPSVLAEEDDISLAGSVVLSRDLANSTLLADSNKTIHCDTKISELSSMANLKMLAKATMKNIGREELNRKKDTKNKELEPTNKVERQGRLAKKKSANNNLIKEPTEASSASKREMRRSISQGTSSAKKANFRRCKSVDGGRAKELARKEGSGSGASTPKRERIPRRIKRNNTLDRATTGTSSSKSPSIRRPSQRTSGAAMFGSSSPANKQRIGRHSSRGKDYIGNHQLRTALQQPQHTAPNVLSKDLDDENDGDYDDPYGHVVDDDGGSQPSAVPRATEAAEAKGSPSPSTSGVDLNTVDFTSLDSASVHKILEHCGAHHDLSNPTTCSNRAKTKSLLSYEEHMDSHEALPSKSCHGRLLEGTSATKSPDGVRPRGQRRHSATGVLTTSTPTAANNATATPCGMNPQRQRRRLSAGRGSFPAGPSNDIVAAALSGYPARRQRRNSAGGCLSSTSAKNASIMTDGMEGIVVPMTQSQHQPLRRTIISCHKKDDDRFNDLDDDSDSDYSDFGI